jgi:glutamate carboxypeptidase
MNLLQGFGSQLDEMLDRLRRLVEAESPSADLTATAACAEEVARLGEDLLGSKPEMHRIDGRTHLLWQHGPKSRVMLLGHFDTVWPLGTLERWPFSVKDGQATGPGIFDMKAGIVQGFFALAKLASLDGVSVLMTSDEEVGSGTSQGLIEDNAKGAEAVLLLEPSFEGALKIARKGSATFRLDVGGRAAHSGLEPELGVNALVEMAHQVLAITQMAKEDEGTTVVPTVASAGTTDNTVPDHASVRVNMRAWSDGEMDRVASEIAALRAKLEGSTLSANTVSRRPPMEKSSSKYLFEVAQSVSEELGLKPLLGVEVGGGSDGNITAALGVKTLDGLGGVGNGAHAEGEYVLTDMIPERTALLSRLVSKLLNQ